MIYMTEENLCELLKVSRSTLWELRKEGLPYRRVRGQIRYRQDEVETWLDRACEGNRLEPAKIQEES